jgi:hypothetical protein
MGKPVGSNGTHKLAQAYVDSALKIQEDAGSPTQLSSEDYDALVERAEAALHNAVPAAA